MSELKEFDESVIGDEDEYETPKSLYEFLCNIYNIYPKIDVAATYDNKKCEHGYSKRGNGLLQNWDRDVWCNPPHSKTKEFVLKAHTEWLRNNINILMLVPANSICASYFDHILENNHAVYYRISGRPQFLRYGKLSKYPSRNSYFVVVWRRR